jgi:hypothetical protein
MSSPRILLSSRNSVFNRLSIRRANEIEQPTQGNGPCISRMATPEELAHYRSLPMPKKKAKRKFVLFI